jgi:hypothetical protein
MIDEDERLVTDDEKQTIENAAEENDQAAEQDAGEDAGEIVVSIGEPEPEQQEQEAAPEWVRDLRRKNREDQRRIRELEDKLQKISAPKTEPLGEKPTLEGCEFDPDAFERKLVDWHERKRKIDSAEAEAAAAQRKASDDWQKTLDRYGQQRTSLRAADFDEVEATTADILDLTQQGIVISGAENPAIVIYALGKNEKKAKELAAITDPVKFAFAIAKLEAQLKISRKKPATEPEKRVAQGSAPVSGAVDSTLERLRAEAAKTGDMTKVIAYKRTKR